MGKRGSNELAATIAFFVAALIAMEVTRLAGNVSLLWPANALAAALLVRDAQVLRVRAALSLWFAGALANIVAGADTPLAAGAFATVNVFEIWLTTWMLRGLWRDTAPVVDLALAGRILLLAGVCAPVVAAVPGAWIVHALLDIPMARAAATWWQSSVCGAAIAAPTIYLYSRDELRRLCLPGTRQVNLALALASLAVTFLAIRFVDHSFIVIAAPLVLAALRMGGLGAAILSALNGLELVAFWALGMGPELSARPLDGPVGELPLLPVVLLLLVPVAVGVAVDDRRRAVQAHRASQRWMQQLVEQSPIGMCILTLHGVWELTNAALEKMLGYRASELLGSLNMQLFVEEEFAAGKARALELLKGERAAYTIERRFRSRTGAWIWTRCTTTLMRDASGAPARFIVQIENLAERRRIEQDLAAERERLATTLRAIADAVFVTDAAGNITYMNAAAERLLGKDLESTRGRLLEDVLIITPAAGGDTTLPSVVASCAQHDEVVRRDLPAILNLPHGNRRYIQETASPLHDPDGAVNGIVVVLRDVRSEFEREQKLRREAELDELTGLANRRAVKERIATVAARCETAGTVATLLLIDLDHFKRINDLAGHPAGDAMLREVAAALRHSVRSSDLVGRLGGDEFVVVLEDCAGTRARQIAEEMLRNVLAIRLGWSGEEYRVGASVGGASLGERPLPAGADTARWWLAEADHACYTAKRAGRSQIRFAEAS